MASPCPLTVRPKCPSGERSLPRRTDWTNRKSPLGFEISRTTSRTCKNLSQALRYPECGSQSEAFSQNCRVSHEHDFESKRFGNTAHPAYGQLREITQDLRVSAGHRAPQTTRYAFVCGTLPARLLLPFAPMMIKSAFVSSAIRRICWTGSPTATSRSNL